MYGLKPEYVSWEGREMAREAVRRESKGGSEWKERVGVGESGRRGQEGLGKGKEER